MPTSDHKRRLTAFVVAMAVLIATPLAVVATDAFTDVSTSGVHHDNITWLKDAGVTSGCNPPDNDEYCPTENVTRAQMATFMRNLAENQVVDAATAAEADHAATADHATTADSADTAGSINGVTVERFFHQAPAGTTDEMIGTFGPMTLYATCDGPDEPTLRASWDEDVNNLTFEGSTGSLGGNATVDAGTTINIATGPFGSVGLAEAVGFDTNFHTSVEYFLRPAPALGDAMCFFSGFVTIG